MQDRSITIRRAQPTDAPEIARLVGMLAEYDRVRLNEPVDAGTLSRHLDPTTLPHCEALLAVDEKEGRSVGYALFFHTYSTFLTSFGLWLEDLFVLEPYRGRGIGFGLFTRVCAIARDRNCARVDWSVLNWNEPALNFYDRIGATTISDRNLMRIEAPAITNLAGETAGPGSDST
ncbi:MAG: GNAT family N-acetyltransferase [Rhodothermales bacterium]|nr:GNAT family N-acetyltransferase [Rhodothermales bacterium]